ncbi:hypothetical protein AgCh_014786 [Apium graveolens]
MEILLAELNRVCIYSVPKYMSYSDSVFKKEEAYNKAIGYQEEDGKLGNSDTYVERVRSCMKLYVALVQTEAEGVKNPHGIEEGWAWMARFLNALPANLYTVVSLQTFIEMAGFALYRRYRSQFKKMLNIISRNFVSALEQRPDLANAIISPSTINLKLKFPTPGGNEELKGDREMAGRCYGQALLMEETEPGNRKRLMTLPKGQSRKKHREHLSKRVRLDVNMIEDSGYSITNTEARIQKFVETKEKTKVEPAQQTIEIELESWNQIRKIKIGKGLETAFQRELIDLLKEYADVFAWTPEDMPGIYESVAMQSLDVDPKQRPIKQKRRNFAPERQQAIDEDVEKLLKANIICEIKYPDWLANVVLVKKPNEKWRMKPHYH